MRSLREGRGGIPRRAPTSVRAFLPRVVAWLLRRRRSASPGVAWHSVPGTNPEHVFWRELTEDERRDRPARAPRPRRWLGRGRARRLP
jgi:hypothetical protein